MNLRKKHNPLTKQNKTEALQSIWKRPVCVAVPQFPTISFLGERLVWSRDKASGKP